VTKELKKVAKHMKMMRLSQIPNGQSRCGFYRGGFTRLESFKDPISLRRGRRASIYFTKIYQLSVIFQDCQNFLDFLNLAF